MKPRSGTELTASVERPLCVDMDGTLLMTDSLQEKSLSFLKHHFWQAWRLPLWLLGGKANLKRQLAREAPFDVEALPVSEEFLQFLRQEHDRGRSLVLATGAEERTAQQVADRFGIFSEIIASDGRVNRTGSKKVEQLVKKFGRGGFDYAGNSKVDLPIWEAAEERILVNGSASLQHKLEKRGSVLRVFSPQGNFFGVLLRALRPHQWAKNLLLLVPVVTGHQLTNPEAMWKIGLAFTVFCLCSSSVYVANDLHDLEADRHHRTKRHRAFASGQCPIVAGLVLAPLLALLGMAGAAFLPPMFFGYLALYYLASTAYSWFLKRVALLDVFVLAGLYTLRILAGHGATGIRYSSWLLALSMFLFLSLALLKRYIELRRLSPVGSKVVAGRDYQAGDLVMVLSLGAASGYMAVLVLALYINSEEVRQLYTERMVLLFICPLLLYWVSRVWLLATRDQIDDDPVVFALKDKTSYIVGALAGLFIWLASVV